MVTTLKNLRARLEAFKTGTGVYSGQQGRDKARAREDGIARLRALHRRHFLARYAGLTPRQAAFRDAILLEPYVGDQEAWRLAWRYWRRVRAEELAR